MKEIKNCYNIEKGHALDGIVTQTEKRRIKIILYKPFIPHWGTSDIHIFSKNNEIRFIRSSDHYLLPNDTITVNKK